MAAVGDDRKGGRHICIWEIATGLLLAEHSEPHLGVVSPTFSEDGRTLSYVRRLNDRSGEVVAWEYSTRSPQTTHRETRRETEVLHHRPDLGLLAVERRHPVNKRIVIEQRVVGPTGRVRPDLTGLVEPVRMLGGSRDGCLAYSRDGELVAAASVDGTVIVWDATTGRERFRGKVPPESARELAFSPDGRALAVAWGTGPASRVDWWEVSSGHAGEPIRPAFSVQAITFTSDRTLAIGLADGTVRLWGLDPRPPSRQLRHRAEVWDVAFSPDGTTRGIGR